MVKELKVPMALILLLRSIMLAVLCQPVSAINKSSTTAGQSPRQAWH
ncbi:hypothetical protein QNM99_03425 [Pseudomonas sp. PCH446]